MQYNTTTVLIIHDHVKTGFKYVLTYKPNCMDNLLANCHSYWIWKLLNIVYISAMLGKKGELKSIFL